MIVKYDSLDRLDKPALTLCNPGSTYANGVCSGVVGMMADHSAEEIVFNFNALSELNLRVQRVKHEDPEEEEYAANMYRAIQNRRLIFIEDIGYFMIVEVKEGISGNVRYKDIQAQSIDVELEQKMIPYIADGTYPFYTGITGNPGIIEQIVSVLPLWTIGHIDSSIQTKYRTFEDVDVNLNCLSFMVQNLQDAYECIFIFDPINRTINVYDQADYVVETSIHITNDDLINTLDIQEDATNVYTAISVEGDNDLNIAAINPLGTNTIYNFDYYIGWMTPSLGTKVRAWQNAITDVFDDYLAASRNLYVENNTLSNLILDGQKLESRKTMYQRCRDNIVANSGTDQVDAYNEYIAEYGGIEITIMPQIEATLTEIDGLIASTNAEIAQNETAQQQSRARAAEYQAYVNGVRSSLAITSYFTQAEYDELANYIFEGSYTDSYITITESMDVSARFDQMKTLFDRAVIQLEKVSVPTQEFSLDVENFLFVKEFEHFTEQLETGCLINVEIEQDNVALLFLSNMTVNYDDHKMSMTFGNRFNKFDPGALFNDVLGQISKTANTLSYYKDILYPIKNGEIDEIQQALETSRNITMGDALSAQNQSIVIDESGIMAAKYIKTQDVLDPRQLKITNNLIVLTDDGWETAKVAIGELTLGDGTTVYGINADTILAGSVNAGLVTTGRLQDRAGKNYWDLESGDFYMAGMPILNLLPPIYYYEQRYPAVTSGGWTNNGITWTVDTLGRVHATGTASDHSYFYLTTSDITGVVPLIPIDSGRSYFISGCPNISGCSLRARSFDGNPPAGSTYYVDSGSGDEIEPEHDYVCVYARIDSGATVNDVIFSPMLNEGAEAKAYQSTHMSTGAQTQEFVFNKLTNNGALQGLYMSNGQLYINSSYINTGVLSAGEIQDKAGKNYWNLDTGEFRLSTMPTINLLPSIYRREYLSPAVTTSDGWTSGGVKWTVDALGRVTGSGTATADNSYFLITANDLTSPVPRITLDPAKSYFLQGGPAGGSQEGYSLRAQAYDASENIINTYADYGDGVVIPAGATYLYVWIRFMAGTSATRRFWPMLSEGTTRKAYQSTHGAEGQMNASIKVNSDSIALKVDSADYTAANIVGKINGSSLVIDPDNISLVGKTIAMTSDNIKIDSTNFKVDKNGNITASGGSLGPWNFNASNFWKGTEQPGDTMSFIVPDGIGFAGYDVDTSTYEPIGYRVLINPLGVKLQKGTATGTWTNPRDYTGPYEWTTVSSYNFRRPGHGADLGSAANITYITAGEIETGKLLTTGQARLFNSSGIWRANATPQFWFWRSDTTTQANTLALIFANTQTVNGKACMERFYIREYSYDASTGDQKNNWENYYLPTVNAGRTTNASYQILTTKTVAKNTVTYSATVNFAANETKNIALTGTLPSGYAVTDVAGIIAQNTGDGNVVFVTISQPTAATSMGVTCRNFSSSAANNCTVSVTYRLIKGL